MQKPAIIVINSLVARGSVGGRASVFVLEQAGFPVWWLPTVLLPWHPGHGRSTRQPVGDFPAMAAELAAASWLGEVGAVLSGYFGGVGQVEAAAALVRAVKARTPAAVYLCDPIVGDGHGLFQPEPVAAAIRDLLLPMADIATPNRFELAWFANAGPGDNAALAATARRLGPKEVVVTSAFAGEGGIGNLAVTAEGVFAVEHARFDAVPHGTGDLLAPLYLAARLDGRSPEAALKHAVGATFAVIERARALGADELPLAGSAALIRD